MGFNRIESKQKLWLTKHCVTPTSVVFQLSWISCTKRRKTFRWLRFWLVCVSWHGKPSLPCLIISLIHTNTCTHSHTHTLTRSQLGRIARLYVRYDSDAMTTKTMKITQLKWTFSRNRRRVLNAPHVDHYFDFHTNSHTERTTHESTATQRWEDGVEFSKTVRTILSIRIFVSRRCCAERFFLFLLIFLLILWLN